MPHRANQTSYKKGHAPTYGSQVKRHIVEGQQFGGWTIIREVTHIRHQRRFLCRCQCEKEKIVHLDSLTKGLSESCGCKYRGMPITHGLTKHPLYVVWRNIKSRCLNQNVPAYRNYGGRGISISSAWKDDPTAFIRWALENGWTPEREIDRIDNDGNYEPPNCRCVSRVVNASNRCRVRFPHEIAAVLSLPA
jgi:hypothetical protein